MIRLPAVFQKGMVLQRDKPVAVWGTSAPSEKVYAEIQNVTAETVADSEGRWCLRLPELKASDSERLTVRTGDETVVIEDAAVGEVWLAGGQSNMEFHMRYEKNMSEALRDCSNARIRFYDVPEVAFEGQLEAFDYSRMGCWRKACPENLEYFSAVGYYFGKALEQDMGVPVGIIGCNWGGTTSPAWMDPATIEKAGRPWLDEYRKRTAGMDMDEYHRKQLASMLNDRGNPFADPFGEFIMPVTRTPEELGSFFAQMGGIIGEFLDEMQPTRIPGCLYEHMLKTIAPYTVKGVLWYQGESDDENGHSDIYGTMLRGLISDWRAVMEDDCLPFLIVQLPGFERWLAVTNQDYVTLREHQQDTADTTENVWLCSISDAGEQFDIHPKNKKPVGERLALLARGHVYGKKILCDAPRATGMTVIQDKDGTSLIISFSGADGGLEIRGGGLSAMEVFCGGREVPFDAHTEGDKLIISMTGPCEGLFDVRFARTAWYSVNLYNTAGIPAVPFELSDELQIKE